MSCQIVLGFDYGTKKIGVAVGNTFTKTAGPVTTIANDNNLIKNITKIIQDYKPQNLLVGLPLTLSGDTQYMSDKACEFADILEKNFNIKPQMVDERLSSKIASSMLVEKRKKKIHKAVKKTDIDVISATLLVEQWLLTK
jgi:putative holliday junction resolvase